MPTIHLTIQGLVAPVVLISANGLICLALYNRLAAISSRARTFHKEWFDLFARFSAMAPQQQSSADGRVIGERIRTLDELGHQMIGRAKLLRNALYSLMLSVLCQLACSFAIGMAQLVSWANWLALACFYSGIMAMMWGVSQALRELRDSLAPLLREHAMIEEIHRGSPIPLLPYDPLDGSESD